MIEEGEGEIMEEYTEEENEENYMSKTQEETLQMHIEKEIILLNNNLK